MSGKAAAPVGGYQDLAAIYRSIMDDVVAKMKPSFVEEGVEELSVSKPALSPPAPPASLDFRGDVRGPTAGKHPRHATPLL